MLGFNRYNTRPAPQLSTGFQRQELNVNSVRSQGKRAGCSHCGSWRVNEVSTRTLRLNLNSNKLREHQRPVLGPAMSAHDCELLAKF